MKNADSRLAKLETSIKAATPAFDWGSTKAYEEMPAEDRERLHSFADRFTSHGLTEFSDEELNEFERLVSQFAQDGGDGAEICRLASRDRPDISSNGSAGTEK